MIEPSPTLLTPTPRLARNLLRTLATEMTASAALTWFSPAIYNFSAWLAQLRDNYLLTSNDPRTPVHPQQSLLLWQSLIDREVFIGEPQVADLAQRAWRALHEYQLESPEHWSPLLLSEDNRRFKDWAIAYRRECSRRQLLDEWTFAAELPLLISRGQIELPRSLELAGFELPMTPLQQSILHACESAGCSVTRRQHPELGAAPLELHQYPEADDELFGAARWARALLKNGSAASIAVVVPDLASRVDRVDQIFRQVFDPPGYCLQGSMPETWHISLGKALADWPLVADALSILSLPGQRFIQPQAKRLLRSPFLAGWPEEADARNATVASLIRSAPHDLTIRELSWALERGAATQLHDQLNAWIQVRRESADQAWPSQWVGSFQQELSQLGFGNGRMLDSREFQVLQRWHELLESISTLDLVCPGPVSRADALAMVTERAGNTIFRERNCGVPVEVLGVEEALGSRFDALWLTTLDSNTWPGSPSRDPLLPGAMQAQIPRATSQGTLQQATLELAGLLCAAPVTRGSYARGSEEISNEVTGLLTDVSEQIAPSRPMPVTALFAAAEADDQAPSFTAGNARGGTGVLRDQSSCPFRAFAQRRLGAVELKSPRPGLDAGQRGTVVHKALEHLWQQLQDSTTLVSLPGGILQQHIQSAVTQALNDFTESYLLTLTAAGRRLEQSRTERVVTRWLEIEKQRADFVVLEQEQDITLQLGGLSLSGQIDRLDRLADGSTMLIDYKTGRAGRSDWFPEPRIVDPQLPAYAVAMDPPPFAITFARIRPEDLRFDGLAAGDTGTPGVAELAAEKRKYKGIDSWAELVEDWQTRLTALAEDFISGRASVDPRKSTVCNTCHLHALCRINERAPQYSLSDDDDE